jgi:hypothetical protein
MQSIGRVRGKRTAKIHSVTSSVHRFPLTLTLIGARLRQSLHMSGSPSAARSAGRVARSAGWGLSAGKYSTIGLDSLQYFG